MVTTKFHFQNASGRTLSGVLEATKRPVSAWAVFAHCFTCSKASLAATHISRGLARCGIGVLRFDFTGLGESEGEFGAGLSGDVDDIVSAAHAMREAGKNPALLVGHSFGGAAVLAAAGRLAAVKAVAVIGTPFSADHILAHLGSKLSKTEPGESAHVTIAGRDFELGADFVRDVCGHDQGARIADLRRALLVLHSPVDEVVAVANASAIFGAAQHPKSFVSLDHADHLLTRRQDSRYAAEIIATWAARYVERPVAV